MAAEGGKSEIDMEGLLNKFKTFAISSSGKRGEQLTEAEKTHFNAKANGKMIKQAFEGKKQYTGISAHADIVLSQNKDDKKLPYMTLTREKIDTYLTDLAVKHLCPKLKLKEKELARDDPRVEECKTEMASFILSADLGITKVKESKTGNVKGLTDTSKYTGTSKERFDASGKGKGKEGRVDKKDDSGYVLAYKGKETYDSKQQ
ncbi:hypothetical protein CHS0354_030536 [Potamilus streckersoni]|uniref:Tubulin polymerization-promoting protein family member 3 n=1 Tax=Potamilus streckersoni TaxID=2493646 RepID=A0AAE0RPJ5_9BIVA|nr:hypothetical protein CHS0354_030536 [Potamilus streckersoni]